MAPSSLSSSLPAWPANGIPCWSSWNPGASPTNIRSAFGFPAPKTTWVRPPERTQRVQPAVSSAWARRAEARSTTSLTGGQSRPGPGQPLDTSGTAILSRLGRRWQRRQARGAQDSTSGTDKRRGTHPAASGVRQGEAGLRPAKACRRDGSVAAAAGAAAATSAASGGAAERRLRACADDGERRELLDDLGRAALGAGDDLALAADELVEVALAL